MNHVEVVGNDRTNDHVIYRELRTRPGNKYNKSDIIRTIQELQQLGYFDAEQISPDIQNANPNEGTVDVKWNLVESGASQIELQGGYGGGGFIGTLGPFLSITFLLKIFLMAKPISQCLWVTGKHLPCGCRQVELLGCIVFETLQNLGLAEKNRFVSV